MKTISETELFEVLKDWNLWGGDIETGMSRAEYSGRLVKLLSGREVCVVTGPRRAGKSTILRQTMLALAKAGTDRRNLLFVNFEDPRLGTPDVQLLEQIVRIHRERVRPTGRTYIFLDEVQAVDGWEKWVGMMRELNKASIAISGSNARLLSRELSTLLTGRHLDMQVFPLSFKEYGGFSATGGSNLIEYLQWGGFPEVVLSPNRRELLQRYFEDIFEKDLTRRFRIRRTTALSALMRFYMANPGALVSFSSAGRFTGLSTPTVEKFSHYCEEAYLAYFLKRFSYKVKEQENSQRKVYPVDTGISNAVGFRFSENIGHLAETAVFLELKRRQAETSNFELYYWKDARAQHYEVDFLCKHGNSVKELLQVCWNARHPETRRRELRSLDKAMEEFELESSTLITEDEEGEERLANGKVRIVALKKWLELMGSNLNY